MVKTLPAKQKTWVQSLGWEDLLDEDIANHSSISGESPWIEHPGRLYSPWGCKELDMTETIFFLNLSRKSGDKPFNYRSNDQHKYSSELKKKKKSPLKGTADDRSEVEQK